MIVHFIDIGQGDSIYIKMPSGEDLLIDAGNKGKVKDVVAYIKKLKVDDIGVEMISFSITTMFFFVQLKHPYV